MDTKRRLVGVILAFACAAVPSGCGQQSGSGGSDALGDARDIPFIGKDVSNPGSDTSSGNHAPVLERIGDRVVAVGQTLKIEASATDADGDALTFSVYGDVPQGAKFDKGTHVFTWVPLQADKVIYLTF
ncbi:MAG: hypothetical protein GXP54_09270, partial [Deltaproteobacteria bacterium]|nr:hypothetical protein [Deltaproteobacteria bacterium]